MTARYRTLRLGVLFAMLLLCPRHAYSDPCAPAEKTTSSPLLDRPDLQEGDEIIIFSGKGKGLPILQKGSGGGLYSLKGGLPLRRGLADDLVFLRKSSPLDHYQGKGLHFAPLNKFRIHDDAADLIFDKNSTLIPRKRRLDFGDGDLALDDEHLPLKLRILVRGSGCFSKGTKILLDGNREKTIESLQLGDLVWNPFLKRGTNISHLVKGPERNPLLEIGTKRFRITVTEHHPFFTPDGLVPASQLRVGTFLKAEDNWERVERIRQVSTTDDVWNLQIDEKASDSEHHAVVANGIVTGDLSLQESLMKREPESQKGASVPPNHLLDEMVRALGEATSQLKYHGNKPDTNNERETDS